MKITFIENRTLDALNRTVSIGDTLESSDSVPEELLQAYVSNGIAVEAPDNSKFKIQNSTLSESTSGGKQP